MFNPVMWKIEPVFFPEFSWWLKPTSLEESRMFMSSPLFSTMSIEMGQQAKPVPILVPFLLKAGGDKLHQALLFDMEKEVLSSEDYGETSQSFEVGKPSSSLELARRVLVVSCR